MEPGQPAAHCRRLRTLAAHLPPLLLPKSSRTILCGVAKSAAAGGGDGCPRVLVPRLALGSDAAKAALERDGFCICTGALSTAECEDVLDGMWRCLKTCGRYSLHAIHMPITVLLLGRIHKGSIKDP